MYTLGYFKFPETLEECQEWKPIFKYIRLHKQVLVVAKTRIEGAWNAYCVPVPGENHDEEYRLWEREGTKLPEEYARPMFPGFDGIPYAK